MTDHSHFDRALTLGDGFSRTMDSTLPDRTALPTELGEKLFRVDFSPAVQDFSLFRTRMKTVFLVARVAFGQDFFDSWCAFLHFRFFFSFMGGRGAQLVVQ